MSSDCEIESPDDQGVGIARVDAKRPPGHLAGGNDVAGLCDLIVCAEDATFAFPPARDLGCLPNQMWFYHLGPQWTKRLALTGDSVDGKTAAEIGLALKCVPAEDLEEEVEGIADRMCLIDPECVPHFRSRLVDCIG